MSAGTPSPFDAALQAELGTVLDGLDVPPGAVLDLELDALARLDSLAALEILLVVEAHLGVELDLRASRRARTLREVVQGALADRVVGG